MRKWVAGLGLAAVVSLTGWILLSAPRSTPTLDGPLLSQVSLVRPESALNDRAQVAIDRLLADPADSECWYQLGLVHRATGADDRARRCFEQAASGVPPHARAGYHLAILDHQDGLTDAAVVRGRQALAACAPYSAGWCRVGEWLLELDDLAGAREAFEQAAKDPGADHRPALGAAMVAMRERRFEAALSLLGPLVARNVSDPRVQQFHAMTLVQLGRGQELPPALATVSLEPPDPWLEELEPYRADRRSRSALASELMSRGNVDAAIAILESMRRDEPDNPALVSNLVAAHRAKGDLRRSAELGEEAVRRFPDAYQPYFNLALTRLAIGSRPDGTLDAQERIHACRLLDAAIARNPAAAQPRAVRARLHLEAGEPIAAVEQLRQATIAEPRTPVWALELARAEVAAGQPQSALETLERARRLGVPATEIAPVLAAAQQRLAAAAGGAAAAGSGDGP